MSLPPRPECPPPRPECPLFPRWTGSEDGELPYSPPASEIWTPWTPGMSDTSGRDPARFHDPLRDCLLGFIFSELFLEAPKPVEDNGEMKLGWCFPPDENHLFHVVVEHYSHPNPFSRFSHRMQFVAYLMKKGEQAEDGEGEAVHSRFQWPDNSVDPPIFWTDHAVDVDFTYGFMENIWEWEWKEIAEFVREIFVTYFEKEVNGVWKRILFDPVLLTGDTFESDDNVTYHCRIGEHMWFKG